MAKKRILLADADEQTLADFRQALGEGWEVTGVASGNAALAAMEKEPSDVVVADLNLPEVDGAELLNRIQATYPKTIRFILAREADHERVINQVLGAHQFIGKPLDSEALKTNIERGLALESWIPKNSIRELVSRIRTLPTMPSLYLEVLAALRAPDTTTDQVASIIAKDMAMMTKLLQVLNSACFGLSRKITNPTEAVGILGFETISSMVMTIKLLSQYDMVKPVYFSIDRLWKHSTDVARTAKQITLWHTDDHALAEVAFTGGLLHDLGKVVLAANFDEQYRGAQSLARKQQLPLCDVEKEIFGASHGEIGAYLLGRWGMPLELLEVAALHQHPSRSISRDFSPLTAVHIANALEYEVNPDKEGLISSKIDEAYLAEVGVLDSLPGWREAVLKREFSKPVAKAKPATAPAAKPAAVVNSESDEPATFAGESDPVLVEEVKSFGKKEWIFAGAVAFIVVMALGWLCAGLLSSHAVRARTENVSTLPNPAVAATKPVEEKTPAPVVVAPTPVPVKPAEPELNFADVKLQGIFYSSDSPAAIINGKMLQVHGKLGGITVVEIKSSSVTLEYKGQRKTLVLR